MIKFDRLCKLIYLNAATLEKAEFLPQLACLKLLCQSDNWFLQFSMYFYIVYFLWGTEVADVSRTVAEIVLTEAS